MSGFVYKWIDTSNGMYYIGSHKGTVDDGYIGSGTYFSSAFNKRSNSFVREVLYVGPHYRELEEFILEELDAANDKLSYNLKNTAIGFGTKESNPRYGKNKGEDNPSYGFKKTKEQKQKISDYASTRTGSKNSFYGNKHTKESKEKIGRANNRDVYVESTGKTYHSIAFAASELNISVQKLYNILYGKVKNTIGIKYTNEKT